MDFYTYLYLREDGTPYYAGKELGLRISRKTTTINVFIPNVVMKFIHPKIVVVF